MKFECWEVNEIAERIAEEASMVNAYLNVWKSTGTAETAPRTHVQTDLEEHIVEHFAWPEIQATPTPERCNGRADFPNRLWRPVHVSAPFRFFGGRVGTARLEVL